MGRGRSNSASRARRPGSTAASHTLIFDEAYYVNAARVIVGIHPPQGAPYADAPLHKDPNAEHPQLAKLIIAAGIELLGDNPWGWRLGSVIFGLIAIVAMYALVRAARGSPWLAVGACGVMALDNLMLVHGFWIATLDVYFDRDRARRRRLVRPRVGTRKRGLLWAWAGV